MNCRATVSYTLGDMVELSQGLAINIKTKYLLEDTGLPLLRIADLISRQYCQFVNPKLAPKKCLAEKGDLIYTRTGQVGLIFRDQAGVIHNNSFKIIPDEKIIKKDFLYWFLSQAKIKKLANDIASGSVQKDLNHSAFKSIPIDVPDFNIQDRAIKTLDSLEKKIAVNRQTNQTLELMAQAIFKSWFVDFDPVKAKMNGEQPEGMDAATASLFPEKLVESELGLIPKGWEPKQLKEVLELAYGKALKKTDRVAGDVPVYGSGGLTGYHNQSLIEGPGIIVGRKGTVGSVYWEPKAFYPIDTVFYVKPKTGYSLKYCHLVLQNLGLKDMNTDAAVPGLNRNNAYRLDVITPSEPVLKKFEEMMQSFQSKVDSNNAQNASLESLRDTLLPKLLSGEIELNKVNLCQNL